MEFKFIAVFLAIFASLCGALHLNLGLLRKRLTEYNKKDVLYERSIAS